MARNEHELIFRIDECYYAEDGTRVITACTQIGVALSAADLSRRACIDAIVAKHDQAMAVYAPAAAVYARCVNPPTHIATSDSSTLAATEAKERGRCASG